MLHTSAIRLLKDVLGVGQRWNPLEEIAEIGSRAGESPFRNEAKLIVHCSHHKAGTLWLKRILTVLAGVYDLPFKICTQDELRHDVGFFMEDHSEIDVERLPDFAGSHLIRDPRDMAIAAYFYHMWCKEPWVLLPSEEYGNNSLQSYLNSLPQDDGIMVEIRRGELWDKRDIRGIKDWDYDDPRFIELKYEDLIARPQEKFRELFEHYDFTGEAISLALDVVDNLHFTNRTRREIGQERKNRHLRSGKPGQWREYFTPAHKNLFKDLHGDLLVRLGYETNNDW